MSLRSRRTRRRLEWIVDEGVLGEDRVSFGTIKFRCKCNILSMYTEFCGCILYSTSWSSGRIKRVT